jgi:hypothetical protein
MKSISLTLCIACFLLAWGISDWKGALASDEMAYSTEYRGSLISEKVK